MKRLIFITIIAAVLLIGAAPSAHAKACGSITTAQGTWIVGGTGTSCKKMKRWTRSMLRGKGRPKGWKCHKRGKGSNQSGGCDKRRSTAFFIYYPPH